jgi:signal peptidase I
MTFPGGVRRRRALHQGHHVSAFAADPAVDPGAPGTAQRKTQSGYRHARWLRWTLLALVALVVTVAAVGALVSRYSWYEVSTASMSPTITPGTLVFVDTSAPATAGDVVAVRATVDGVDLVLVKRAVAVGAADGSTVVEGRGGTVVVDGKASEELYLPEEFTTREFAPVRLAPGEVFLLGDNRGDSRDSIDDGPRSPSTVIGVVVALADPWPSRL